LIHNKKKDKVFYENEKAYFCCFVFIQICVLIRSSTTMMNAQFNLIIAFMKKFFLGILVLFLLFVGVLVAAPFFFKDQIVDVAKKAINEQINGEADFKDVSLSLIRSFPDFELTLKELKITNAAPFEGTTLAEIEQFKVVTHWRTLLNQDNPEIKEISLVKPKINIKVLKDGKANWDIMKASEPTAESTETVDFKWSINEYSVKKGSFVYDDLSTGTYAQLEDLNHVGKGDFTLETFLLDTKTEIGQVLVKYGGVPYLSKVEAEADAVIFMDMGKMLFTLKENKMRFNDLHAILEGSVGLPENGIDYDLKMSSPDTNIKHLLSLLPSVYTDDFRKIKTEGTMAMNGSVKGLQTDDSYPAFDFHIEAKDGLFKYPGRDEQLEKINVLMDIKHPQGGLDATTVNIPNFEFSIQDQPVKITANIAHPMTDPLFNFTTFGQLDLARFSEAYPTEELEKATGQLNMDIKGGGRMSDFEKENYRAINLDGAFLLENALFKIKDMPDEISFNKIKANISPQKIFLADLDGKVGKSDFQGNGSVRHFLDYYFGEGTLEGTVNVSSNYFNVNQFMTSDTIVSDTAEAVAMTYVEVPENINFTLNFSADETLYDDINMKTVSGALLVKDESITFDKVQGAIFNGNIVLDGVYSTKGDGKPSFDFNNQLQNINIKEALTYLNTLQLLAPLLNYVEGDLTTSIGLNGLLGENLLPVPMSMSGKGSLRLIEGSLKEFLPLDKIASTLEIKSLEKLTSLNTRSYFEFQEGRVEVKPFTLKREGLEMTIAGFHGFDQSLNYSIDALIPRNKLGSKVNSLIDGLTQNAIVKDMKIKLPDMVPVSLALTGTVKNPVITADYSKVLGDGKNLLQDQLTKAADSLKALGQAKVDELVDKGTAVKDSLVRVGQAKKDSLVQLAQAKKDNLEKLAKAKKDSAQAAIKARADSIVEAQKAAAKVKAEEAIKDNLPIDKEKAKDKLKDLFGKP